MSSLNLRPASLRPLRLLALAGLLWPGSAQAQVAEIKPARIEYEYFPSAGVNDSRDSGNASKARFQAARASVTLPTPLAKGFVLIPSLRYQVLDVGQDLGGSGAPARPGQDAVEALHSLTLSLGGFAQLSPHWGVFARVGGGLAGDLSGELSSDDWVVDAQALGLWTITEGFTIGAGVGYDRRTGEVAPLPLIGVNWEPRSDLLLRGVLPQSLSLRYRPVNPVTLGFEASLDGERYHLSQEDVEVAHAEVAYSVIKFGPSVTLHWTRWLHTRVNAGLATNRRFEVFVDDHSRGDLNVDRGPYAGLELWLGPSGWSADAAETALAAAGRSQEPESADSPQ